MDTPDCFTRDTIVKYTVNDSILCSGTFIDRV